jgi:hypothetical protein
MAVAANIAALQKRGATIDLSADRCNESGVQRTGREAGS